ncbi:hypothetical protein [Dishui Lake phycodnavirus 4]|nr:hypothetical protein [Dishui Lake phycodnavirus 4]
MQITEVPTLTYAVEVCNEDRELYSLLSFLVKTKSSDDDINVLVDSGKETREVSNVLEQFKDTIKVCRRHFDGDFAAHRNYHIEQCKGDYLFMIDADEIPQETLIKNIKDALMKTNADLIYVPRMNISPGYTAEWLARCNFKVNDAGFINWPDFQGRIFKNTESIRWTKNLHEKIDGAQRIISLEQNPTVGIWHIKTVERQDKQDAFYRSLA